MAQTAEKITGKQLEEIALSYVNAPDEKRPEIEKVIMGAIEDGVIDQKEFEAAVNKVVDAKKQQGDKAKPEAKGQQQQKPQQQQAQGKGDGGKSDRSTSESDGDDDQKEMMRLWLFFKALRILVMFINVRLYMVMADVLLLAGAAAEAQGYIKAIPLIGWGVLFAIAWLMWFGFQKLETYKGEGTWAIRGGAYVVDTAMSVITFPPLLVDWQLFLKAPMLADVNQKNFILCAITVGAWELLNFVEQKVFMSKYGKKVKFGFWGVKRKSLK